MVTYSVSSEAAIQPSGLSNPTCTQPFARPNTPNFSPEPATRITVADELGPLRMFAGVLTVTIDRFGKLGWISELAGFWVAISVGGVRLWGMAAVVGTEGGSTTAACVPVEFQEAPCNA